MTQTNNLSKSAQKSIDEPLNKNSNIRNSNEELYQENANRFANQNHLNPL